MSCAFARAEDRLEAVTLCWQDGRFSYHVAQLKFDLFSRNPDALLRQSAIPPPPDVHRAKELGDRTLQSRQIRLSVSRLLRRGAFNWGDRYRDLRRRGESCSLRQSRICLNHSSHLTRGSGANRPTL